MIRKEKYEELQAKMKALGIEEEDLEERFILGSGRGGQKLQKSSSCVQLKHVPTGLEVKCQKARGRELNRYYARKDLCEKLDQQINKEKSKKQQEIEKIRRQKKRRSRRSKEKMLEEKKRRSDVKELRKIPKNHSS